MKHVDLGTSKRSNTPPVAKDGRSHRRVRRDSLRKTIFTNVKYIKPNNAFGGGKVCRKGKKKKDGEPKGASGTEKEKMKLCANSIAMPPKNT